MPPELPSVHPSSARLRCLTKTESDHQRCIKRVFQQNRPKRGTFQSEGRAPDSGPGFRPAASQPNHSNNTELCHKQYHYTDVAVERDDYEPTFVGSSDHDIVAAITAATLVLEGKPAPAPFSIKDKPEALLLLAHLVGNIHQPLHVGAVYLAPAGQLVAPDKATPFDPHTETRGANDIHDGAQNLHAEWDTVTGRVTASHIESLARLAAYVPTSPEPMTRWSTIWASDTVEQSHQAFAGLAFTAQPNRPGNWLVAFTDRPAYVAARTTLQEKHLATAGKRLAQLLNGIWK